MMKTPELNDYQRRLWRLLYKPDAVLRFYYDGGGCYESYHFSLEYTGDDGQRYKRDLTEHVFLALEEYCDIVKRWDWGRERNYSYWYTCKPRDLVTDEDRAWMNEYERREDEDGERS